MKFSKIRLHSHWLKTKLEPLKDVSDLLVTAGLFSTSLGKIGLGVSLFDFIIKVLGDFDINEMTSSMKCMSNCIFYNETSNILNKYLFSELHDGWKISKIKSEIEDIEVYWRGSEDDVVTAYSENIEVLKNLLSEHLFSRGQGLNIEMDNDDNVKITAIDFENKKFPKNIENFADRIEKFDYERTILLHGEPGTGKSTIAQWLASKTNKKFISISMENLRLYTLTDVIDILKPYAVIIDDFDRFHNPELFLKGLEEIRKRCPLIIATVNSYKRLDSALIRPGRFDDHFEVEHLDEELVKTLLGENLNFLEEYYEQVKKWPIVYIVDLNKRINKLGIEYLKEEFDILKVRLETQRLEYGKKIPVKNDEDFDD